MFAGCSSRRFEIRRQIEIQSSVAEDDFAPGQGDRIVLIHPFQDAPDRLQIDERLTLLLLEDARRDEDALHPGGAHRVRAGL